MINRCELAASYHQQGFNCCQSVLAAFQDRTGLSEQASFNLGSGFGRGAGTGELCGVLSGAIMTLGFLFPVDPNDPIRSKKRSTSLAKELQQRFTEKFGALRCQELLKKKIDPQNVSPAAQSLGANIHCRILIVTAVELVEEILAEQTPS